MTAQARAILRSTLIITDSTFNNDSAADGGPGADGGLGLTGSTGGFDDEGTDFDSFAAEAQSLHDHLMTQAGAVFSGPDLVVASHIIDQIDEAGYLEAKLLDIANRLGIALARVEAVLAVHSKL